jgi:UDP-N-acetylmuramoylalanine--D-glutamate ligase
MILLPAMRGKTVAVLGLGLSGRSTCRALQASGARVWAWDDDAARRAEAAEPGVTLVDLAICNWTRIDRLVPSPGIPLHHPRPHPLVRRARDVGVEIAGDIELLVESRPRQRIVGITGTNGKSTTTALIGTLLQSAGVAAQVGGNIGLPVLDLLPKPGEDIYVLELSSYQLELTERLSCNVAVILNVSPDHLDRHGGISGYVRAKQRILRNQKASDWAVIGVDDEHGEALFEQLTAAGRRRVLPIGVGRSLARGVYVVDGRLHDTLGLPDGPDASSAAPVADLSAITSLRGAHNWQNAAAAYAAVRALGVDARTAAAGLRRFQGLAHRLELVATQDGVQFVNDSKATNPAAAARALASFERIHWIAGGRPKEGGLDPVLPWLDRVRHAYLIGEAAADFEQRLAPRVPCTRSGDLASAVAQAAAAARAEGDGAVVLLAPACASFDQFRNFEARGDAFRALVGEIVQPAVAAARGSGR